MKVALIGPSEIEKIAAATGIDEKAYEECAFQVGKCVAESGDELVIVPDRGVPLLATQAYRTAKGRRVIGLIPISGIEGQEAISECENHRDLCDSVIDNVTWFEQHAKLCEMSDVIVCIGLSCGTICEIAWTKWTGKTPILIFKKLVSNIPKEIVAETNITFITDLNHLERSLNKIRIREESNNLSH